MAEPVELPQFTGTAEDVALAVRAWAAGVACTHTEPTLARSVELAAVGSTGGYSGHLRHADDRAWLVAESLDRKPTIAHEIAHLWSYVGPATLVEGRARWLAGCMADRDPVFAKPASRWRPLDSSTDVSTWEQTAQVESWTSDNYEAARRLVGAVEAVTGPGPLYARFDLDWAGLFALLPPGPRARVEAVVYGGVDAQRAALSDDDRDGVSTLEEELRGWDPTDWDSDDDGWWDGARPPAGARPLPPGASVCGGVEVGATGGVAPAFADLDGFLQDPDWRSRHGGVWWRGEVPGCAVGRRVAVSGAGAEAALLAAAVDTALDRAVAAGRWPRDLQVRVSCADREARWNDAPELVVLSPAVRARLLRVGDVAAVVLGLAWAQRQRDARPAELAEAAAIAWFGLPPQDPPLLAADPELLQERLQALRDAGSGR